MNSKFKNILLHITAPLVNFALYAIAFAVSQVVFRVMEFISRFVPSDYQVHADGLVMQLARYFICTFAIAIFTEKYAPSHHLLHFCIVASIIIVADALYLNWTGVIGGLLGLAFGIYYLKGMGEN